jgi:hypothetical protein
MPAYNAEISAGSLLPLESKRLAALLLTQPDEAAWWHAVAVENILQKQTPITARRQATLIRKRLRTLDAAGWTLLVKREQEVAMQLLLVAAIRHSQLLGDFMRHVYAERQRGLEHHLVQRDWQAFLADCAHHDGAVAGWSASTRVKLFQVIVRILVEAKYLADARTMTLTPQSLHPEVRRYLAASHDTQMIHCLERAP